MSPKNVTRKTIVTKIIIPPPNGAGVNEMKQLIFQGFDITVSSKENLHEHLQSVIGNDYRILKSDVISEKMSVMTIGSHRYKDAIRYKVYFCEHKTFADAKPFFHRILHFWELFSFILPAKTRKEAYEPAFNDLKADYVRALQFKSSSEKRWLKFCFTIRTVAMVINCLWVLAGAKFRKVIWNSISESYRKLCGG
jgi:hypothetical protein